MKLAKVDIDSLGELSSKYNVQAVPTGKDTLAIDRHRKKIFRLYILTLLGEELIDGVSVLFVVVAIKNGKEISRFTGAADESRIEKMIDQLGRWAAKQAKQLSFLFVPHRSDL